MKETLELEIISDQVPKDKITTERSLYYALTESPLDYRYLGRIIASDKTKLKIDTFLFDQLVTHAQVGVGTSIFIANDDESSLPLSKAKVVKRYFSRVTKDDWETKEPITADKEELLDFEMTINEEQKAFFELGTYPLSMDHKWFMYCENDIFHFLRSWTGKEFFKGELVKIDQEQWRITAIKTDKTWQASKAEKLLYIQELIEGKIEYMDTILG